MLRLKIVGLVLCIWFLTGCGNFQNDSQTGEKIDNFISLGEEPDLSYEVPVSTPNILVNQLGYITDSSKVAVFRGDELPGDFEVINADTGKSVFKGVLEDRGYNKEFHEYNSYGSFTELTQPGTYYIVAPVLGRSYTFVIGDKIYDSVFIEAFKQYYNNRCGMTLTEEFAGKAAHNACHTGKSVLRSDINVSLDATGGWHQDEKGLKDVVKASESIAVMLLAYELYGEAFSDEMNLPESGNGIPDLLDEVHYEIEWLLKMQDAKTGAVYAGITVKEQDTIAPGKTVISYIEPESKEASLAFAMVLSKFSYLYQNYDMAYATSCLKAADKAWKYVENMGDITEESYHFAAAAELYRASGKQDYQNCILEYLNKGIYKEDMDEFSFFGCATYISTKQKVNRELCADIVKSIMSKAEMVALKSRQSQYLTAGNKEQDNNGELLKDIMHLTFVDHIITNHEYQTIIENHLHYFMGRNAKAISYIENVGENNKKDGDHSLGIMKQFDKDSILIFMLSEIVLNHQS